MFELQCMGGIIVSTFGTVPDSEMFDDTKGTNKCSDQALFLESDKGMNATVHSSGESMWLQI